MGLSNSATQKQYIDATAKAKGLENVEVHLQRVKVAFDPAHSLLY